MIAPRMPQFHEGQDVAVRICEADPIRHGFHVRWNKAKIVTWPRREADRWRVQFPDGTRAVFDTSHIRTVANAEDQP
jgi:hypothetical protein